MKRRFLYRKRGCNNPSIDLSELMSKNFPTKTRNNHHQELQLQLFYSNSKTHQQRPYRLSYRFSSAILDGEFRFSYGDTMVNLKRVQKLHQTFILRFLSQSGIRMVLDIESV